MKIRIFLFIFFVGAIGNSQQSNPSLSSVLKHEILTSKEVADWQNAMIVFQKSYMEFCALKYEQKLNQNIFNSCGKHSIDVASDKFILQVFRTMRITDELRDSVVLKEKVLRTKYPQLATHFEVDDIFPELYAPIREARDQDVE